MISLERGGFAPFFRRKTFPKNSTVLQDNRFLPRLQSGTDPEAAHDLTKSGHLKSLILPSKQATDWLRKCQHLVALTRINSVSLLLVKTASLLHKAKSIPGTSSLSGPKPEVTPGRIGVAGPRSASPTNPHCPLCSRLTNSTYPGDQEATGGDLEDGEKWGPSSSQKPMYRTCSGGALPSRAVFRRPRSPAASASPRACLQLPQEQKMASQDRLGHLLWPPDPGQSSQDHGRCQPGALCSPQTRARTIWCPVHKYMKHFIMPDTKAKFWSKLNRYKSPENPALISMFFSFFFSPLAKIGLHRFKCRLDSASELQICGI